MLARSTIIQIVLLLTFGPLNTVMTKITFDMTSIGIEGEEKAFHKPWYNTLRMFLGMAPALLVHFVMRYLEARRNRQADAASQPLLVVKGAEQKEEPSFLKASMWVGIPAMLDLLGTIVSFIGLLYNSASVFTMMRGSIIVFSAILSVLLLGRKMYTYNWTGVAICCVAVILVGVANIMGHASSTNSNSPWLVVFGMVMIILSQIIQALQMVTEETLMKHMEIPPFVIVGMEGVWGILMCVFVALPAVYFLPGPDAGSLENTFDTWVMIDNNSAMDDLMKLYIVSIFITNISGVLVTKALSSVHRTMISAMQTAVVWGCGLFVYHFVDKNTSFGEAWTAWSWLQLLGFTMLVTGQGIYAGIIQLPGFYYPPAAVDAKALALVSPASARNMNVPTLSSTAKRE